MKADCIGLDLFNDDTCPPGLISHPTHVNVSQSCFHCLNKLLKPDYMVNVWGLVEVTKFHQIRGDSSDQMYRIFDHSHQIEEFHFSQELTMQVSRILKTLLYHCTLQEHMINAQCLTTVVTSSQWSSEQDMGLCVLGMANSKSGNYNLIRSGQALEFLWLPQCWFHEVKIFVMYSHIPLVWTICWM